MCNRTGDRLTLRALTLAGLAIGLLASVDLAAAKGSRVVPLSGEFNSTHSYAPGHAETGTHTAGPIYSRGYYLGQDPDQHIRTQLLRDGWYGNRQ
jgi:hypothetical protein